jgi:filamentous hemagglutinin
MRTYVPHSKHGGSPGARGVRGSPMDLSDADAQALLNDSSKCFEEPGKKQYIGTRGGKFYVYQPDNVGGYHGYRVSGTEVAAKFPKAAALLAKVLNVDFKRLAKMS